MIRPLTCLCLLAACGSGLYLYAEKHRAELLDREIGHVIRSAQAARERTGMLRAEWALLNEPGRLQELSSKYLHLQPMAPAQFVRLADLGNRLPAPEIAPPSGSTDDDAADAAAPAVVPGPVPAVPIAQAAPPPKPAASAPVQVAERAKPAHAAHPHRTVLADAAPLHNTPLARGAPLALAAPHPFGATVLATAARPVVAPPPPRVMPAFVHSALAGSGSLPPPVPLSPGAR